ncbi:MAG: site-specific integrase [Clostridia bacterium]|nr:site-specific integrase [Clostridia bacterium]
MNYREWLESWLCNYVQPSSKRRTYERYVEIVNQHIIPALGETELNALTPLDMQRFVTDLLRTGNLKTGTGLSSNSVNAIITVMQSSLKTAYTLGYTEFYAADKIKRPKAKEKRVECFSLAEQKKIEQYIMSKDQPKLFGVFLCLYTGLRVGELLALEWSDVDLKKGELRVSKTCYDGKGEDGAFSRITDTPKTPCSVRTVPIPKRLLPLLRDVKKKSPSIYVVSGGEKEISVRSYQRTFTLLQRKLEIPHRGFHALRHTFATRALECGMDVKTLSEILGHKSPTVTLNRYAHSLPEHKKAMMDRLGKLI